MGKLSRYDAGELPEDKNKRRKKTTIVKKSTETPKLDTTGEKPKANQQNTLKKSRSISNRIRDLRRLLAKVTDESAKSALTSKLERLNRRFDFKERQDLIKRLSAKNRKLQFLDLKKLEKRFKRSKDDDEKELIKNDMEYIRTFPKDRRYLSLFDTTLDEDSVKERDELRIKAALARAKRKENESSDASDDEDFGDDFFKEEPEQEAIESDSDHDDDNSD